MYSFAAPATGIIIISPLSPAPPRRRGVCPFRSCLKEPRRRARTVTRLCLSARLFGAARAKGFELLLGKFGCCAWYTYLTRDLWCRLVRVNARWMLVLMRRLINPLMRRFVRSINFHEWASCVGLSKDMQSIKNECVERKFLFRVFCQYRQSRLINKCISSSGHDNRNHNTETGIYFIEFSKMFNKIIQAIRVSLQLFSNRMNAELVAWCTFSQIFAYALFL